MQFFIKIFQSSSCAAAATSRMPVVALVVTATASNDRQLAGAGVVAVVAVVSFV